jgi:hypothetical protein
VSSTACNSPLLRHHVQPKCLIIMGRLSSMGLTAVVLRETRIVMKVASLQECEDENVCSWRPIRGNYRNESAKAFASVDGGRWKYANLATRDGVNACRLWHRRGNLWRNGARLLIQACSGVFASHGLRPVSTLKARSKRVIQEAYSHLVLKIPPICNQQLAG